MEYIIIHTKGRFNYRTRKASKAVFESLKSRGYISTRHGTHSVEAPTDKAYHQLIKATK